MAISEAADAMLETTLLQSGNVHQNNFITVQKIVDYDFLEYKRVMSFNQSIGVREVKKDSND